MATTTTPDLSALSVEVFRTDLFEAYQAATTLAPDAEEVNDLTDITLGQTVSIGSYAAATPALNLAETETIVPKKHTATKRSFTAGRVGDAYEYSYMAGRFDAGRLQRLSTQYLGTAFALRVDINLANAMLTAVDPARKITAAGTGAAATLTITNFIDAVEMFPDAQRTNLVAKLTPGQRRQLSSAVMAGGTQYAGQSIWANGVLDRLYGVPIETNEYLATTTAGRAASGLYVRNRTLVSAPVMDPLIEFERHALSATIDVVMNGLWLGGVQDPTTLVVFDAAR